MITKRASLARRPVCEIVEVGWPAVGSYSSPAKAPTEAVAMTVAARALERMRIWCSTRVRLKRFGLKVQLDDPGSPLEEERCNRGVDGVHSGDAGSHDGLTKGSLRSTRGHDFVSGWGRGARSGSVGEDLPEEAPGALLGRGRE